MGQFTLQLDEVIENIFNESMDKFDWEMQYHSYTYNGVTYGKLPIVDDWTKLGLGTYPIFDELYRPILNGKIVDEYYKREIGVETIDMFQLVLRRKMDQIMPYWNKMYETESIPYNALDTMDIHSVSESTQEGNEEVTATNTSDSVTESTGRAVTSQTPQTMLAGNADYATGASDSKSDSGVTAESNQESASNNSTQSNGDNRVTGYQGIASELVNRYRASLLNIDTNILRDIEDCFMLILNNGDAYTQETWVY
jgi:hypothetical protein